jgi:PAS domain S-box-containing protein
MNDTPRARPPLNAEDYRQFFEVAFDAVMVVDSGTGEILDANPAALAMYGCRREELLGMRDVDLEAGPDESGWTARQGRMLVPYALHRKHDGSIFPVEITARHFTWRGRSVHLTAARDASSRRDADSLVRRTTRALLAMSRSNQALVRAVRENELLDQICQIMVHTAGYRMAWVGFAEHDAERIVRPVSHAGLDDGYLESVRITWDDTEHGRGPTGTAVRTGKPCVVRDAGADPLYSPWRAEGLRRGYASVAALPLLSQETVLGSINLYASEPDAFDEQEVALLADLADNLAYGITSLRTRRAREAAEKALQASHEELEQRVRERTADLASTNAQLRGEIAERRRVEALIRQAEESLRQEQQTLRQLLDVYEKHRQLISYEIHDGVAQRLAAAQMTLEGVLSKCKTTGCPPDAREAFGKVAQMLRDGIDEARRLMSGLRPLVLDEAGLLDAIDYLACEAGQKQDCEIHCTHQVAFRRLASPLETAVFRIVQEALQNACRHGRCTLIEIRLQQHDDRVRVTVTDNGVGFDPANVDTSRFGLKGIRQRAELFGGWATIQSTPGQGTTVMVELPIVEAADEVADA